MKSFQFGDVEANTAATTDRSSAINDRIVGEKV